VKMIRRGGVIECLIEPPVESSGDRFGRIN
jgi:hypothetical protein